VRNKCKDPSLFTYVANIDCDHIRYADRKVPVDQRTREELIVDRSTFCDLLEL